MNKKIKKLALISIFGALSSVLYYLKFPLPIFPSFLQIQFSNLPIIICGFSLGAPSAILALLIKTLIWIMFSSSSGVGELADFIIGLAVVLVTSYVYFKNKTKKGAILALCFGMITWVVIACILNYIVLVPLYLELFFKSSDNNIEAFVGVCSIIPGINTSNYKIYYVLFGALPFNLLLSFMVSLITYLVYKKISKVIDYFHIKDE